MISVPADKSAFKDTIQKHYPQLSKRLRQLARYMLENPDRVVLSTVAELSSEADVPPSTVIRLANALGYNGFSEMRRDLRSQLHYTGSYIDRVQQASVTGEGQGILSTVTQNSRAGLQVLEKKINEQALNQAANLIQQADNIYVTGVRRSYPVASYIAYGLWQLDRRCVLLGGNGGMHKEEAAGLRQTDLVFLISFHPYAEETMWMHDHAHCRSARLITISDNEVSPVAAKADLTLLCKDAEVNGIRGLSSSMALAQSIILSLAKNT